jgi:excisionase family DNA binding protein
VSTAQKMEPDLGRVAYSVEEWARATSVCRTTLYNEIQAGRLRRVKVGKRTIILATDGLAWLEAKAAASTP